ncbi:hypothetical protein A1D22_10885 [Pasteurellaceae bacterium LFhippo2]|nr:hypothetical protein [Pasteurellaceae bacterium LFhippo2]
MYNKNNEQTSQAIDFRELEDLYNLQEEEQKKLKEEQAKIREEIKQKKEKLRKAKKRIDYLTQKQRNTIKFEIGSIIYNNTQDRKSMLQTIKQLTEFLVEKQIIKETK